MHGTEGDRIVKKGSAPTRTAREQVRGPNGQEHLRNHVKTPGLHEGNEKSTQGIKWRTEKIRLFGGGGSF